jgi:hypothetical protein
VAGDHAGQGCGDEEQHYGGKTADDGQQHGSLTLCGVAAHIGATSVSYVLREGKEGRGEVSSSFGSRGEQFVGTGSERFWRGLGEASKRLAGTHTAGMEA